MRYLLNKLLSYEDIIGNDIKNVGTKAYNVALLSKEFNVPKGIVLCDLPIKISEIKNALNLKKDIKIANLLLLVEIIVLRVKKVFI